MNRRRKDRKICTLLERAGHGETSKLRLRYKDGGIGEASFDEPGFLAYAGELYKDWKQKLPLSEEGRDFLMYVLLDYELGPAIGGRLANEQAKAAKAQGLIGPVSEYRRLRKNKETAIVAAGIVARKYPQLFAGMKSDTVKEILQHPNRLRD